MDSSRKAVESYWRSKMIGGVTADEDKVAPVYKLEEICELIRSSHLSIVKEISEFILKRLDHKSPIVKQKALRLIKYSVDKSGVEFKREMQKHSASIRQLFQYKGHIDPLKGDAFNKAVRDTAHDAISAIFSSDDSNAAPSEDISRRIEGFGNTNFATKAEDKKSFLSEVVGIGSSSIKQGLSTFTTAHSLMKNDDGNYRGPNLRRSLTTVLDTFDRFEGKEQSNDSSMCNSDTYRSVDPRPWNHDHGVASSDMMKGDANSGHAEVKTQEERLLETVVSFGGVRLQPSRDALQTFLLEALKLDALALSHALESKLCSHSWQVRVKAVCVLESILRRKEDANFNIVASFFSKNIDILIKCSESPQSSLREKAKKVLSLLEDEKLSGATSLAEKSSVAQDEANSVQMPDLIDTNYDDDYGTGDLTHMHMDVSISTDQPSQNPIFDDLFGSITSQSEDDPFADVSFHTATEDKEHSDDLFSGLTVDDKQASINLNIETNKSEAELDVYRVNPIQSPEGSTGSRREVSDLMEDLSINETAPVKKQPEIIRESFSDSGSEGINPSRDEDLSNSLHSQTIGVNPSQTASLYPLGPAFPCGISSNFVFNQGLYCQPMDYSAMATLFAQQQLLATMNFQNLGNITAQGNSAFGDAAGIGDGNSLPLPDVYQLPNNDIASVGMGATTPKKEETKAFDFISDHLSTARGQKRVV